MHHPETSSAWLWIARSAFTDGFLPTLLNRAGALQGLLANWGALIRIGWVPSCCQRLSQSILLFVYIPVICWGHSTNVCDVMVGTPAPTMPPPPPAHPSAYKRHPGYYRGCKTTISKTNSEHYTAELAMKY